MRPRPRHQIRPRVEEEAEAHPAPRHDGPPQPLNQLPEIVGTAHQLEHPATRHPVALSLLLKPYQHPIGPHVEREAGEEDDGPQENTGPRDQVEIRVVGDPTALEVGVEEVEEEGEGGDGERDGGGGLVEEVEWVEARAVEVVEEVEGDEAEGEGAGSVGAQGEDGEGDEEGWGFHDGPGDCGVKRWTPTGAEVLAVGGYEELEGEVGDGSEYVERD